MSAERPTELLRREHQTVRAMINDLEGRIASCAQDILALQGAIEEIQTFVVDELEPHMIWEQRVMYPLVDRFAHSDLHPFTATMRMEHAILGKWVRKLEYTMESAPKHPVQWIILAAELFGLLRAHLAVEEEVLFPILDAKAKAHELAPPASLTSPHPKAADTSLF